jgi:hypothetical protein
MHERPEQVVPPARPGPDETGEVGSEGGSSGDMLLPSVKPARAGVDRRPGAVPALLWWAVLVPVAVVLLWFLTSLGSR